MSSSSPPLVGALLFRSLRAYQIYGANTEVGKTVFSTILCKLASSRENGEHAAYLKPVSTGPLTEADDGCKHLFFSLAQKQCSLTNLDVDRCSPSNILWS